MKNIFTLFVCSTILIFALSCNKDYGFPGPDFFPADSGMANHNIGAPDIAPGGGGDRFDEIIENPFIKVSEQPLSTFSIDADGASYAYMRRCVSNGRIPDADAIRTEEFLNYFTFDYPSPQGDDALALNAEIGDCPWAEGHKLLRIGLKGKELKTADMPTANYIFLIDTSGSMYCSNNPRPASVALSLGLYFAERNKGIFHNHFIEFSHNAKLIEIKGKTFADRLRYIASFSEIADTNIEAVFDLILRVAVKNRIPQNEMPSALYIISDMEFNWCVRNASLTNFENAKRQYAKYGYRLPNVVFWNVQSRNKQQPVTMNEQGVALVSGCTPKLFSMVASGKIDPYSVMMDIVGSERYEKIVA